MTTMLAKNPTTKRITYKTEKNKSSGAVGMRSSPSLKRTWSSQYFWTRESLGLSARLLPLLLLSPPCMLSEPFYGLLWKSRSTDRRLFINKAAEPIQRTWYPNETSGAAKFLYSTWKDRRQVFYSILNYGSSIPFQDEIVQRDQLIFNLSIEHVLV